ncbi:MAG: DUF6966 domain-containing protein [Candidatus Limnocylindria bacterium]
MAHSVDHLANLMDEMAVLLRDHGEEHWAEWIEADARAVRARDGWGLEHFLAAFGSAGSLYDLIFHPRNQNAGSEDQGRAATDRFHELLTEAHAIALDLSRELATADE